MHIINWPEMPDKWSDRTPLQKVGTVFINAMGIFGLVGIALQLLFRADPLQFMTPTTIRNYDSLT